LNSCWRIDNFATQYQIYFMKKMMKSIALVLLGLSLIVSSCTREDSDESPLEKLSNAIVLEWNEVAYQAFGGASYQHSLMASRINAMTHIAMHDALNAIEPKFATFAFNETDSLADPIVAAATAAYTVLVKELPGKKGFLDSALFRSINNIPASEAKNRGALIGHQAAQAILTNRDADGSACEVVGAIPYSSTSGIYQGVPPFNFVFAPQWENVKLFALNTKEQFRPEPPPSLTGQNYSKDFNEVLEAGSLKGHSRTRDQADYVKFWYEFSEAGWNRIARTIARDKDLNLIETARLFALLDMAIADAYIAGWDAKLHYNFWRPYTAIRNASKDNNDHTEEDAQWEPAVPTPPVQDYPSTHSALGNAAAAVLARLVGDNTYFSFSSPTSTNPKSTRSFASFTAAANENADSRVKGGIHFRFSCKAGQDLGSKIGNWVVDNYLAEVKR
jgi:hypothetical protein